MDFRLNGEPIVMRDGECWYLRLSDTHSVANRGRTDRVHLVIDALVSPWLDEQLAKADRTGNGAVQAPSLAEATADCQVRPNRS